MGRQTYNERERERERERENERDKETQREKDKVVVKTGFTGGEALESTRGSRCEFGHQMEGN